MILVDSSVWAEYLHRGEPKLARRLAAADVVMHPFVVGELAMGNLRDRAATIAELESLPQSIVAFPSELLSFIERHAMAGSGIGYVDAHLVAAARLGDGVSLWTRDKRLHAAALRLGVAWDEAAAG